MEKYKMEIKPYGINCIPKALANSPNLGRLSKTIPYTVGAANEYLSDYIGLQEIDELSTGNSILITAPVGSGKSAALINIAVKISDDVMILTNRKSCLLQ
jgi:hypothetical protein